MTSQTSWWVELNHQNCLQGEETNDVKYIPNIQNNSQYFPKIPALKKKKKVKKKGGIIHSFRTNILTSSINFNIPMARRRWDSGNVLISHTDGLQIRRIISDRDKLLLADGERWQKRVAGWHPFRRMKSSKPPTTLWCLIGGETVGRPTCRPIMCITHLFMI